MILCQEAQLLYADDCRGKGNWKEHCWFSPRPSGTTAPVMEESEHAKALTTFADGQLQHLVQLLIGVVGGEAQLVKTGVCGGQGAVCGGRNDLERGAEGVETPGGKLGGACGELQ